MVAIESRQLLLFEHGYAHLCATGAWPRLEQLQRELTSEHHDVDVLAAVIEPWSSATAMPPSTCTKRRAIILGRLASAPKARQTTANGMPFPCALEMAVRLLLGRRSKLRVAPLRLRFVASLINFLLGVAVLAFAIGAGAGLYFIARRPPLKRLRRIVADREPPLRVRRSDRDEFPKRKILFVGSTQSRSAKLALGLFSFVIAVRRDGRRSLGARAVGIRLVDGTGGEPDRWQASVRVSTRQAWQSATAHLIPWPEVRSPSEHETFRSDVEDVRRRHADDPDALQEALIRIYGQHRVNPVGMSCLPVYLRALLAAAIEVPALWTPLKQGLPDKFARTVVIVERRRSRWQRLAARLP